MGVAIQMCRFGPHLQNHQIAIVYLTFRYGWMAYLQSEMTEQQIRRLQVIADGLTILYIIIWLCYVASTWP